MSQKYDELLRKLKKGVVYVPDRHIDTATAMAGALLAKIVDKSGIKPIEYSSCKDGEKIDEPKRRIGETEEEYKQRYNKHEEKLREIRKDYIIVGDPDYDLDTLYNITKEEGIFEVSEIMESAFEEFLADRTRDYEEMTELSKLIENINTTKAEINSEGFNYYNIVESKNGQISIIEQMLESRLENTYSGAKKDLTEIYTSIEEDMARRNMDIQVNVKFTEDSIEFKVDGAIERESRISSIGSEYRRPIINNMATIGKISIENAKKLDLYDELIDEIEVQREKNASGAPVIDMGGQEVYNSNGDNLTMTIHQIADAMVKCMVSESFDNKREITSQGKTFSVMQLNDKVGGFYEDAAKIAEGSNVIGIMSPGQNDNVVFKPIPNEMAHFENLPGKDGLSITFERGYTEGEYGQSIAIPASEVCINAIESGELELIIDELGIDEYNHNIDELYTEDEEQEVEDDELEIE